MAQFKWRKTERWLNLNRDKSQVPNISIKRSRLIITADICMVSQNYKNTSVFKFASFARLWHNFAVLRVKFAIDL